MARKLAQVRIEPTEAGAPATIPIGHLEYHEDTEKLYVSDGVNKDEIVTGTGGSYTDEEAQDAVGGILTDTSTINFTYDDVTPQISAIVIDDSIGDGKLRNSGALSVIGRAANSTGDPADISAVAASGAVLRESGSVLAFGTIATAGIADDAVTFAKMQNISTDRLLGRESASSGDVEEISLGSGLTMSSTTLNVDLSAIMPACRLTKSADQSGIIAGDELSWDQEDFDTDTLHDNSTNNSRITTSQSGVWLVGCAINTQNTTISPIYAILLNGTTNITASERVLQTSSSSKYYNFSTIWNATAGDYFEVSCINGTSHVVEADNSSFWAIKLR